MKPTDQEKTSCLSASAVVNAAVASTEKYLAFLDAKGTETTHKVTGIAANAEAPAVLVDSAQWHAFTCVAPPRLRLPADSGATFVGHDVPGEAHEIRIIDYDRRTGHLCFAARERITSKEGHIGIDFRWLVRQTLEWLQQRGPSVIAIDAVAAREGTHDITEPPGISPEQTDALRAIVSSSLCYVWGPPGTGKTQWVLAKAVRNCVQHGERVLVLASTNLAVDNALTAVIKDGVAAAKSMGTVNLCRESESMCKALATRMMRCGMVEVLGGAGQGSDWRVPAAEVAIRPGRPRAAVSLSPRHEQRFPNAFAL